MVFEFKEMRIITTFESKTEHLSCIISYKTCSCCTLNPVRTVHFHAVLKGGVFKCL